MTTISPSKLFNVNEEHKCHHINPLFNDKSFENELMTKSSCIERIKFIIKTTANDDRYFKSNNVHKHNDAAEMLRQMGNKEYDKNQFNTAMKLYNKSVAFAPENSETLALALGNRSAVCYQMGLYKDCLKNISLAKKDFPIKKINKLIEREQKAIQMSLLNEKPPNIDNEFKLSFLPHETVSTMANCLEIKNNSIYTNRDLFAGEIVLMEKPFVMLHNCTFDQCTYCLKNCYSMIPCHQCNHAMFCNDNCRQKAYDLYHKYECCIIHYLHNCDIDIWLGIRSALIALHKFGNLNELRLWLIEQHTLKYNPIFDYNLNSDYDMMPIKCLFSNKIPPIHKYPNNNKNTATKFTHNHQLNAMFQTAGILIHLKHILPLNDNNIDIFILHFHQHILNSCNYVKNIITNELKYNSDENKYTFSNNKCISSANMTAYRGFAMHGIASYFKISCTPNTTMFYNNSNMLVVKVIKHIQFGEELLGSYQWSQHNVHSISLYADLNQTILQFICNNKCNNCFAQHLHGVNYNRNIYHWN